MKIQLFVLVCCIASLASCVFIEGVPNQICGQQDLDITFSSVPTTTVVAVEVSVPTVEVTPSSFTVNAPGGDQTISVTCNTITPVTITFHSSDFSITYATFHTFCKGVMYIQNPIQSIIRGEDFAQSLILFPTPETVVDVVVRVDNPIIVPGSDRLTFGVGQDTAEEVFYVPAGPVGTANIAFESRSLRDYGGPECQELILSVDVLGTITSDLSSKTLGDGVFTTVTVKIHPPARDTVVVHVDASTIGIAEPSDLEFHAGQDTATFRLLPKFENVVFPTTVTFTAPYYDTLVEYIYVIGTIFTSIPPVVPTTGVADLHVAILPGAVDDPVIVYLTATSNVIVPPFLTFAPGVSLVHMSLEAIAEGPASVTFSSAGYVDFTDSFLVQDLDCSSTQTFNLNSTQCVACPILAGLTCSGNGLCTYSTVDKYKARCVCDEYYTGGYCEFFDFYDNFIYFTSDGGNFDVTGASIPGVLEASVTVLPEFVDDNDPVYGGDGTIYLTGYPFDEVLNNNFVPVDPAHNPPTKQNYRTVTLSPGFALDITYDDNTLFDILDDPVILSLIFDPTVISQTIFSEMSLYYYNVTLHEWVPAISTCRENLQYLEEDLTGLTIDTNLCVVGQYNFYAFVPIPQNPPVDPVYVYNNYQDGHQEDYQFPTTGGTGVQQPIPPQPHLPVVAENDPSPPRNIEQEWNSSSVIAPSYLVAILLVLSLLF